MPLCRDVVKYVFEIAPDPRPPETTENRLVFGSEDAAIRRIAVIWRPTPELLAEAGRLGADLVVGHEPLFDTYDPHYFWGTPLAEADVPINNKHRALLEEHSMAYARFHTNVDVAPWGMPVALLKVLGLEECPIDWNRYLPLVHIPSMKVYELADLCQKRLGLSHTRVVGDRQAVVSRLAVCWGGLTRDRGIIACVVQMGADGILGGGLVDENAVSAAAAGLPIIECGHAHTEMPGMRVLADKLAERFDSVQVHFLPNREPWFVPGLHNEKAPQDVREQETGKSPEAGS